MESSLYPPSPPRTEQDFDLAIIGAGPVGLATAIELAKLGLSVVVVDRRPPPSADTRLRPQILVARVGDLANLVELGIDVEDPCIVSPLAMRCEGDLASGEIVRGDVAAVSGSPTRAPDLWALARQPPYALLAIGRLQRALLAEAVGLGVTVRYGCDVTKLRRHAQEISLACADGTYARAAMAIIATGAARSLVAEELGTAVASPRRLVGAVFAVEADAGRWTRLELPIPGFVRPTRCTLLETAAESHAGSGLIVDPQLASDASDDQLLAGFDAVAREQGLAGAPYAVAPLPFTTAVTSVTRRFVAGDGRAPVVVAGDAAQTGHVFSGQTCFINLALAIGLARRLSDAKRAIVERKVNAPALVTALTKYDNQSGIGAAILAQSSRRHTTRHLDGAWALAGVARA
jgi:2-polyprenyl-6-methoxyphenol hydroxylase-like FAD-dependent oxidoreductase